MSLDPQSGIEKESNWGKKMQKWNQTFFQIVNDSVWTMVSQFSSTLFGRSSFTYDVVDFL